MRFAREDLEAARLFLSRPDIAPRHACFLAQQSAEKAIKAALLFEQVDFPYAHDLEMLRTLIPRDWLVATVPVDIVELTDWAVASRYPGRRSDPTVDHAIRAVTLAADVFTAARSDFLQRGLDIASPRSF